MKVKAISVEFQFKANMGDYQSATIGASTWADVEEGEDPEACRAKLFEDVKVSVRDSLAQIKLWRQKQVNEILSGLPAELQAAVNENLKGRNGK